MKERCTIALSPSPKAVSYHLQPALSRCKGRPDIPGPSLSGQVLTADLNRRQRRMEAKFRVGARERHGSSL